MMTADDLIKQSDLPENSLGAGLIRLIEFAATANKIDHLETLFDIVAAMPMSDLETETVNEFLYDLTVNHKNH